MIVVQDIIVFGRGAYYQRKKKSMIKNFNIAAFIDSHVRDNESVMQDDVPVYPPSYATSVDLPVYVMTSNRFINEMVHTLQDLGIRNSRIRTGLLIHPGFNSAEDLLIELKSEISVLSSGIEICCSSGKFVFDDIDGFRAIMRKLLTDSNPFIEHLSHMPVEPFSRHFGNEKGRPIDRYYIEQFLFDHKDMIHGDVMEIAEHTYTYQFGHDIRHAYALHVDKWGDEDTIAGDLVTGDGLHENMVDCLICTQTLQMIYDMHNAVKTIYNILKPGGVLLITGSGISQISINDYDNWGEYWRFTEQSMKKLMEEYFKPENIHVQAYGNVKTATCFLYGLCEEDMEETDFKYNDVQYPLIVTAMCRKD